MTVRKLFVWCALVLCASCHLCRAATTNIVAVHNFFFNPINLVIAPGDTVRWTNFSLNTHDTTHNPPSGSPLWQQNLSVGGAYQFRFTNAGYYPYLCVQHTIHQQTGAVLVASTHHKSLQRLADGSFQFAIGGGRGGFRAITEASADLSTWRVLETNTFPPGGSITFIDSAAVSNNVRFYRSHVLPPP